MFTTNFNTYACPGDSISCDVDGLTCTARIERDDHSGAPWEEHDGHGTVSEWTTRPQRPGERVLNEDRGSKRYYDFAEAVKTALSDRWGVWGGRQKGETKHAYAVRCAEADFAYLKAWCDDEWFWCGICVQISKADVELTGDYDHALWGIECNAPKSDNTYLAEVANDLLAEALDAARKTITDLCKCGE